MFTVLCSLDWRDSQPPRLSSNFVLQMKDAKLSIEALHGRLREAVMDGERGALGR